MNQLHFFMDRVEVIDRGKIITSQAKAMVSGFGIYRVFEESEYIHQAFLEGRTFIVFVENEKMSGRLIREQGKDGAHYNLRLMNIGHDAQLILQDKMRSRGFESPWKREHPRIVRGRLEEHVEAPYTIAFPRVAGHGAGEVMNFSYHGMFFEFLCSGISLDEYVGRKLQFHIISNRGTVLSDVEAQVVRIYDEMHSPKKMVRGLGVKFSYFRMDTLKRYQEMLIDACSDMKRA